MTNFEKAVEFLHTSKQLNMPDNIYCEYDIALKACEIASGNTPPVPVEPTKVRNGGGVVDTTHKGTWKRFEETVARLFGTHRIPLSGMSNNLPKGDIISTEFIVECKYRKDIPIWREWVKRGKLRLIYKGLIIFDPLSTEKNIFETKNAKGVKTLYDSIPADGRVRVASVKQKGARGFLLICSLNDLEYVQQSIYRNNKKQNNGISNTNK